MLLGDLLYSTNVSVIGLILGSIVSVFLVKVLSCILIALLFLVAIFSPRFATVLSCLGVVVACSIAAVLIDRRFRRQCYGI